MTSNVKATVQRAAPEFRPKRVLWCLEQSSSPVKGVLQTNRVGTLLNGTSFGCPHEQRKRKTYKKDCCALFKKFPIQCKFREYKTLAKEIWVSFFCAVSIHLLSISCAFQERNDLSFLFVAFFATTLCMDLSTMLAKAYGHT